MKVKYKLEFTFFLLLIALVPIFLYTIILNFEYKKNIKSRNYSYLETVRDTNLKMLEQSYELLINSIDFLIKSNKDKRNIRTLNLDRIKNSSDFIDAIYTFSPNFKIEKFSSNMKDEIFSQEQILNTVRNANFSNKYYLENIDSSQEYNILVFNYFNAGYVALILNYKIFNIIDIDKGFKVDIYNDKYRLIKSTHKRKINMKEINEFTKKVTDGIINSEIIDGKVYSYSMLSMNGAEFYIVIQNETAVLQRFRRELLHYTVFIILFSLCMSFLISWKFLDFINTHVSKKQISYGYDDYQIKKVNGRISENLVSIDRILSYYNDFLVLKNDMEEVKKGLAHRREHVERDEKNENHNQNHNSKHNKINKEEHKNS